MVKDPKEPTEQERFVLEKARELIAVGISPLLVIDVARHSNLSMAKAKTILGNLNRKELLDWDEHKPGIRIIEPTGEILE